MEFDPDRANKRASRFFMACAVFSAWIGFAAFALCLAWQCYFYLRNGFWVPMPALTKLGEFFGVEWMHSPMDWVGVHNMLNELNAGVVLWGASFIPAGFFAIVSEEYRPK